MKTDSVPQSDHTSHLRLRSVHVLYTFGTRFSKGENSFKLLTGQQQALEKHENQKTLPYTFLIFSKIIGCLDSNPSDGDETFWEWTCFGRVLHENVSCL